MIYICKWIFINRCNFVYLFLLITFVVFTYKQELIGTNSYAKNAFVKKEN